MSRLVDAATAARNNASWCDAVCRTHGSPGVISAGAWTTAHRSPPLYPDAVTLDPRVTGPELLQRIDAGPGCSVKDSFATLDLAAHGFRVLFQAEWISLDAQPSSGGDRTSRWQSISGSELDEWAAAWATPGATSPFRRDLLADPDIKIVAGRDATRIVAGAVLNRAAGAVGVTNLFSTIGDLDAAWTETVAAAGVMFPNEALAGYESGDDLEIARRHAFVTIGPLRVWIKDAT